ncbi:hypothetical protein DAEQUDRAFT_468480 [Daedalea quercina L-15889]|uniref:Uncharacterized protein n=1 Tax=Daedalea quercina L-15889 TaxID=1314783 RepID=A0A165TGF2_9APHY|nr:hypothetical protein DAEQUDRAFT_468480 [Daedalea quercina L-15889]
MVLILQCPRCQSIPRRLTAARIPRQGTISRRLRLTQGSIHRQLTSPPRGVLTLHLQAVPALGPAIPTPLSIDTSTATAAVRTSGIPSWSTVHPARATWVPAYPPGPCPTCIGTGPHCQVPRFVSLYLSATPVLREPRSLGPALSTRATWVRQTGTRGKNSETCFREGLFSRSAWLLLVFGFALPRAGSTSNHY